MYETKSRAYMPRNEQTETKKSSPRYTTPHLREAVIVAVPPEYGISATGGPRDLRQQRPVHQLVARRFGHQERQHQA